MELVLRYQSRLEERVRTATPGWGWYTSISKASLPWVPAFMPAIAVEAFTPAPFWLVLALCAVPMLIWLFVQFTMLAEINRVRKERRDG